MCAPLPRSLALVYTRPMSLPPDSQPPADSDDLPLRGPWNRRAGCDASTDSHPAPPQRDTRLRDSIVMAACFVAVLWNLHFLEFLFQLDVYRLGVLPREPQGLVGVVTGPLIHGSWSHLVSNTLPLLLLGSMLMYGYPRSRWRVIVIIWLVSGLGVWLFARSSFHFGASGLTHGMFFFLFTAGILRRDRRSAALLMVAFYMYGGMVLSIFPGDPGISFEYHAFGALAGIGCGFAFRDSDPRPQRRRYSWEDESEQEDPVIGEQWRRDE